SLNATFLVPSRLAIMLSEDGAAPAWIARIAPRQGTPVRGLTVTFLLALAFLVSGQLGLALNIAVLALVILYAVHRVALLLLPRLHPALYETRTVRLPRTFEAACAVVSACAMAALVVVMLGQDAQTMRHTTVAQRIATHQLTGSELLAVWAAIGVAIY